MYQQSSSAFLLSCFMATIGVVVLTTFLLVESVNASRSQETTTPEGVLYLPIVLKPVNTPTPTSTPTHTPTSTSTTTPSTPLPIDGVWEGTTKQGRPITFTIASRAFTRFITSYRVGGCGALQVRFFSTPEPITGNTFMMTQTGTGQVKTVTNGTFSTDHCASGDMKVTGTQCGGLTTTWIAIKQGSNGATCPFTPTPTPGSNDKGRVIFTSERDDNFEIYAMNANGSAPMRLTNNTSIDSVPHWSPDGTKIAFHSNRDGNYEIYVMNADGSGQTRLTTDSHDDAYPTWSPDGQQIAFSSNRIGGLSQIWVMQADGTGQKILTSGGNTRFEPEWSPDSTKIIYAHYTGRSWDIYQINADGSGETDLSNLDLTDETNPKWSPDGSKIVFESSPSGFVPQVYVMNADGSAMQGLTTGDANYAPTWSPDGKRIMFTSNRDGNSELYVMNADGSDQTRLTDNSATDSSADWIQ
ncbi:MAG: hypothetical protein U0350_25060 [Caldilineaceae bacterium]